MDLIDLYERASAWTLEKAAVAARELDQQTPCEGWDVRTLMNHMLATQQYFIGAARGEDVEPPGPEPPALLGDDPAEDFRRAREETLEVFGRDGVVERTGPALGIAFSDQLLPAGTSRGRPASPRGCRQACPKRRTESSTARSPRSSVVASSRRRSR